MTIKWIQRLLFAIAIPALAYCAFVLIDGWAFQRRESAQLQLLVTASKTSLRNPPPAMIDGLIGRIDIERIGVSVMVIEGTGATTLRRAAGHIPGTALPGQPGNTGISAHRDSFFRPLRNIRQDDVITVTTPAGEYRYSVVSTKIVDPSDVAVLASGDKESLTLVTCYPFYFVGSAPNRFIVRARRLA